MTPSSLQSYFASLACLMSNEGSTTSFELISDNARIPLHQTTTDDSASTTSCTSPGSRVRRSKAASRWDSGDCLRDDTPTSPCPPSLPVRSSRRQRIPTPPSDPVSPTSVLDFNHASFKPPAINKIVLSMDGRRPRRRSFPTNDGSSEIDMMPCMSLSYRSTQSSCPVPSRLRTRMISVSPNARCA